MYDFSSSAAIMSNTQPECSGCQHQNRCEDLYRRIGHSHAPSVTGKVVLAFAVPMLLAVLVLAGSERLLRDLVRPELTPMIGVALTVITVLLYGWIVRRVRTRS
jgi:hypothetical protein